MSTQATDKEERAKAARDKEERAEAEQKAAYENSKKEMAQQRATEEQAENDRKKAELDAVDKKFEDGLKYSLIALGCALVLGIVGSIWWFKSKESKKNSQQNQVK
jgi:hypothetical protein